MRTNPASSPSGSPETVLRAPLLEATLQNLDPDRRVFVIDLGGLRPATLETFSAFRCRLDILDLDLDDFSSTDDSTELSFQGRVAEFERALPELDGEQADLLLCWSYLNYLTLEQLALLMPVLCDRLGAAGQVHALIESSATQMPARPRALSLAPEGGVFWPPDSVMRDPRPTPRYSADGLLRCLSGFVIERTMLLANGQKEFLFQRP